MRKSIFYGVLLFSTLLFSVQSTQVKSKEKSDPSVFSLEEVIETTLAQNPELKAMQKDADATRAKVPQARSWDDTMIGVRFFEVPFNQGITSADDIDYIISQKIPFPGKKKAASKMVYHEYLYRLELAGKRGRELLKEVKSTYYTLFAVHHRIEINQKTESVLKQMIQAAQSQVAANRASSFDPIQAQTELAKVLTEKELLLQEKQKLEAKLNQLMNRPIEEKIKLPLKLELPQLSLKLEELLEMAELRHPSIKMAEHQIDEKKWGIKAAKREYLPDLNAQLEYLQKPGPREDAWTGEFMLNIPLMIKKKMKGVESAEAELAAANYSHLAAKNEIAYRVKELHAKMETAEKILKINQGSLLPQTQQAFEVAVAAYKAGKGNFSSLLLTTRSLFDSETEYWKSYETFADSCNELEEAIGITAEEIKGKKI